MSAAEIFRMPGMAYYTVAHFLHSNLDHSSNDAIPKLYTDTELREKLVAEADAGMLRSGPFTWNDRVFLAEMTRIAESADKAYAAMLFRVALKCFLLRPAKRKGRVSKGDGLLRAAVAGERCDGLHKDLVLNYFEL
ncbi:hypothetical protein DFJ73DRAFT_442106 [Zopfochytrium polystomum]|nr:hypothetical protein DFJ73DRAFT_442106 [Zopfochytrium polystomum]